LTARYLLDTSVILDHVNGHLPAFVLLNRLFEEGAELMVCAVVVSEALARGDEAHRHVVSRLLSAIDYVPADASAARAAGDARSAYRIGLADALVVATARRLQATIVSRGRPAYKLQDVPVRTY
jgi:predicted nucleic acid-binding protein